MCSTLTAANVTLQFVPSGANGLPSEGGVMHAVRAVTALVRARQSLRNAYPLIKKSGRVCVP